MTVGGWSQLGKGGGGFLWMSLLIGELLWGGRLGYFRIMTTFVANKQP